GEQEAGGVGDLALLLAQFQKFDLFVEVLLEIGARWKTLPRFDIVKSLVPDHKGSAHRQARLRQPMHDSGHVHQVWEQLGLLAGTAREHHHAPDFELEGDDLPPLVLLLHRDMEIRETVDLVHGRPQDPLTEQLVQRILLFRDSHQSFELLNRNKRRLPIVPSRPQIIRAEFPQGLGVLAGEFVLQTQIKAGIHGRVVESLTDFRRIGIRAHAVFYDSLRQQVRHTPLLLAVLTQDVPFHKAAYQPPQRFLQVFLIMALIGQYIRQFAYRDLVHLLGGQLMVSMLKQDIPGATLQQGDVVLNLNGCTMLDDLLLGFL